MEFSYTYNHTKVHRWYISTGPTYTLGSPEGTCNWSLLQSPFVYCPVVVVFSPHRRRKFCFHDWTSSMFAQSLFMFSTLCSILVLVLAPSWWSWSSQTQYTGKLSQQWDKRISWHKPSSSRDTQQWQKNMTNKAWREHKWSCESCSYCPVILSHSFFNLNMYSEETICKICLYI